MATAKATTNHDEIRTWVEARGGNPARVKRTGSRKDPGILRIDFPGFSGEDTLEEIEWDEFFEWFDRNDLALLLSEEEGNRFNKLVSRETPAPTRSAAVASRRKSSSRRVSGSSSKKAASAGGAKRGGASRKGAAAKKASASKKASSLSKKAPSTRKASSSKKTSSKKTSSKKTSSKKTAASTRKASSSKKTSASTKKASTAKKAPSSRSVVTRKATKSTKSTKSRATGNRQRATKSNTTTNHDEIRRWVEARGGFPAHVRQTGRKRGDLGVLRIDYPGYSGKDTLERVDWEEWFAAFDRNKLAFLHDNKRNSRFSKLVNR